MPKSLTNPEQLIQQIQDWQIWELEDLRDMIQGLLEAQQPDSELSATRLDGSPIGKRGGRGCIELKMIPDTKRGKTYGPYRYLRYQGVSRKTGKTALLSVYLGKAYSLFDQ